MLYVVKRWTKKVDMFSMVSLFITVHRADSHWAFLVVHIGANM